MRKDRRGSLMLLIMVFLSHGILANGADDIVSEGSEFRRMEARLPENCWLEAGRRYYIDPWLLYAIAQQESGLNNVAVNLRNKDGSIDIGLMQINTKWLPRLNKYGIRLKDLYEPCMNVHVGAWILALAIRQHGSSWEAVGAYNAGSNPERQHRRAIYAASVYRHYVHNMRVYGQFIDTH